MHSRWFNTTVVMLWLATMSWLVKEKVLPPMLIGEPPNYSDIVAAQKVAPPVGWQMSLNGRSFGWALSDVQSQSTGLTNIHGRVHFDALPLEEVMPRWLSTFSKWIEEPVGNVQMDTRSLLVIDSLGHLVRLDSEVRVDPLQEVISLRGTVEGRQLQLTVKTGDVSLSNAVSLPSKALLCDAISPQTYLPGLRIGQTWTVPVYSPLRPATNPLEIIHARVEGLESIAWNGAIEGCWLVVYRDDSASGTGDNQRTRGKLWVRRSGEVLKQQISLFDATITFTRLSDDAALKLTAEVGPRWWSTENDVRGNAHD